MIDEQKCLCCGLEIGKAAVDADFLCTDCDGNIFREITSNELIYN